MKLIINTFLILGLVLFGLTAFAEMTTIIRSDGTTEICTPIGDTLTVCH